MLKEKGFTLIELVAVMFLITLMIGISAAVFSGSLPSQKAEACLREMITTFRQARAEAIASSRWQTVIVDMENRKFGIDGRPSLRSIPEGVSVRVVDPLRGEFEQGVYRFVFSPSGVAEGGRVIVSAGNRTAALDIDPVVGATYTRLN